MLLSQPDDESTAAPPQAVACRLPCPEQAAAAGRDGGRTMSTSYKDRWIECTADAVLIRGYYFPWGTKRIPYSSIRAIRRVTMGTFTGKGRIRGSTTLRYWASLDPGRPAKSTALILDTGHRVLPFITPDDPQAVETAIREHSAATTLTGRPVIA
jgi:hypothetical protein